MSKGLTMSKTLCAYDFMQMTSLIDRLCRIRLEKSHSKLKKSHSTKINSNAIIEKKEVCIIVLSHSTY